MVVQILRANGTRGVTPAEIARRTGMAKRTVYRDLNAIGGELGIPVWSEGGRWGVDAEAFLPPLRLTLSEAMAIFLSARLLARYMDKHDPDSRPPSRSSSRACPPRSPSTSSGPSRSWRAETRPGVQPPRPA